MVSSDVICCNILWLQKVKISLFSDFTHLCFHGNGAVYFYIINDFFSTSQKRTRLTKFLKYVYKLFLFLHIDLMQVLSSATYGQFAS